MSRARGRGLYGDDAGPHQQRIAFTGGAIPVAVYGLGKMGLPLAAVYADVTGAVTGVDVDEDVVRAVERGDCPVAREPGLDELVAECVDRGALAATTEAAAAADAAGVHVVIVPTTLDGDSADLSALEAAIDGVAAGLDPGDVVVIECTVPPGTCREVVVPALAAGSGLDPSEFGVAFCPERTSSGRALEDIRGAYPKVVGGVDAESTRVAELVYDELVDNEVVAVSDAMTAECVKLFEGVYRDVNIALANELARFGDGADVDVREAIDAANALPVCDIHDPGAGVGGHCIPYYPYFLMGATEARTPLLETARAVNDGMPSFVVEKVREGLAREGGSLAGSTVLVLGVTYRAGVAETRAAPAKTVVADLLAAGADVRVVDPLVSPPVPGIDAPFVPFADLDGLDPDAAVLVTAHAEFDRVDWTAFDPLVVVDGRDALDLAGTDHRVYTVGRG